MMWFRKKLIKKDISDFELAKLMGEPFLPIEPIVPFITIMTDKCFAYQWYNRFYLDEYSDQKELREEYFSNSAKIQREFDKIPDEMIIKGI